MSRTQLQETTLRDFGGGWDLTDSDKALSARFQTVSDNIIRGTDGHWAKRYGTRLAIDLKQGVETVVPAAAVTVSYTNAQSTFKITKAAHGYTSGQHIKITDWPASINQWDQEEMVGKTFGIVVNDANNFTIYTRIVADATVVGGGPFNIGWIHDTHVGGGNAIFGRYFSTAFIVFFDSGEVVACVPGFSGSIGTGVIIWSYKLAAALTLAPWTSCDRISAEIVRGKMIAVNGRANDKPIAIQSNFVTNYMIDASTLSNGAIPRADFVIAASNYIVLVSTEYGTTKLEIGAKNTVMTASREVSPADAVEIDVGMLTQTVDPVIYAANVIRSKIFLAFTDRSMLGILGIYNASLHEPDFNDNIAEFGSFAHAATISLGNDLFTPGYNGVNSLQQSTQSAEYQPQTISDLIHPAMLKHFRRLSTSALLNKCFAVWDNASRSYMLFLPKYEPNPDPSDPNYISLSSIDDPILVTSALQPYGLALVFFRDHYFDEGDYIYISNVTGITGVPAASFNGLRRIRAVPDKDYMLIEVGPYEPGINASFGGPPNAVHFDPYNDGSIGYIYEYNPKLKIKRWTRFTGLNFAWGARSQLGHVYFGASNGKIYQYGNPNFPIAADEVDNYDTKTWANSTTYAVGYRIWDTVNNNTIYECQIAHTSDATSTFEQFRDANPYHWLPYQGKAISFALETAWSDFGTRRGEKQIELVGFDTIGSASFTFSIFANDFYRDPVTMLLTPNRQMDFVARDGGGWGQGDQVFAGGRNTKYELLHSMPVTGKLFKLRFEGSSIHPLQMNAVSLHYHVTKVMT